MAFLSGGPRRAATLAVLSASLALQAVGGQAPAQSAATRPGFATVAHRTGAQVALQVDTDKKVLPADLDGRCLVIRYLARTINFPQSGSVYAKEWKENGRAELLPIGRAGGQMGASLVWEDREQPVKPGDRVELVEILPNMEKPWIEAIHCLSRNRPLGNRPVVAPGQEVWLRADVLSPSGAKVRYRWATDVGQFRFAGGGSAGRQLDGPCLVRWAPGVSPAKDGATEMEATVRLAVAVERAGQIDEKCAAETTLTIRVQPPQAPFVRVGRIPSLLARTRKKGLGALFGSCRMLAPGGSGTFCLVDEVEGRIVRWGQGGPETLPYPLETPVQGLNAFQGTPWLVQGAALRQPLIDNGTFDDRAVSLAFQRLVDLQFNRVGDLIALDSSKPDLVIVPRDEGAPETIPLTPRIDSPWLTAFCVDPLSDDVYVLDTQRRDSIMIRQWRRTSRSAKHYRNVEAPISVMGDAGDLGPPVALLARPNCDRSRDLPVQVVYASGAVSGTWQRDQGREAWKPNVVRAGEGLSTDAKIKGFRAQAARRLPDSDILLGGQATWGNEPMLVVAQLSARGEFRRMLPASRMPPRSMAVAPDGSNYVLYHKTEGVIFKRTTQRLVQLGPDGWIARVLELPDESRSIRRLRPDRSSADHLLLVRDKAGPVVRYRIGDPGRSMELTATGLSDPSIPGYKAQDVHSSPHHIVVLDTEGRLLLFASKGDLRFAMDKPFPTGLRRPMAVSIHSNIKRRQALDGEGHTYVCVLASKEPMIHVWELTAPDSPAPGLRKVGAFPDQSQYPIDVQLKSPVAMDTGFPGRREMLYVVDVARDHVRAFDVAAISPLLQTRQVPEISGTPVVEKLSIAGGPTEVAVGPGQLLHVVDEKGQVIHTYARWKP